MAGHLKRRRPADAWRPEQMLHQLMQLRLIAVLRQNSFWISVHHHVAECLNLCCIGQVDGGPGTAYEVADLVAAALAANEAATASAPFVESDAQLPDQAILSSTSSHIPPEHSTTSTAHDSELTHPQGVQQQAMPQQHQQASSILPAAVTGQSLPQSGSETTASNPLLREAHQPSSTPISEPATVAAAEAEAVQPPQQSTYLPPPPGGATSAGPSSISNNFPQNEPRPQGGRGGGGRAKPQGPILYDESQLVAVRLTLEETFFLHYVLGCLAVFEEQPHEISRPSTAANPGGDHALGSAAVVQEGAVVGDSQMEAEVAGSSSGGDGGGSSSGGGPGFGCGSRLAPTSMDTDGWLLRSGLLYGTDFVVYQMHPGVMHSEYGIMVVPLSSPHDPQMGWHDVQITNRLINQVAKRLVLLYVLELPGGDHSTPDCMSHFTVEERLITRWVPDATRDIK